MKSHAQAFRIRSQFLGNPLLLDVHDGCSSGVTAWLRRLGRNHAIHDGHPAEDIRHSRISDTNVSSKSETLVGQGSLGRPLLSRASYDAGNAPHRQSDHDCSSLRVAARRCSFLEVIGGDTLASPADRLLSPSALRLVTVVSRNWHGWPRGPPTPTSRAGLPVVFAIIFLRI